MTSETNTGTEPVGVGQGGRMRGVRGILFHALFAVLAVIPPFQVFVPAVFLSAGIRHGRRAAWLTLAVAFSIVVLGALGGDTPEARLSAASAAGLLIFQMGIPAMVLLYLAEAGAPGGRSLVTALGVSVIGVMIVEAGMSAVFGYSPFRVLSTEARALFDQIIAMNSNLPASQRQIVESVASTLVGTFLPAVIVCNAAMMLLIGTLLIPRFRGGDEGDAFRLRHLRVPDVMIVGFVVSGLSPFATGIVRDMGLNLLAVVVFFFWLQGLAVIRMMLTRSAFTFLRSVPAFLLLALLAFNWIGIAGIALTGLFDSFFDFRNMKRKEDSDESDPHG